MAIRTEGAKWGLHVVNAVYLSRGGGRSSKIRWPGYFGAPRLASAAMGAQEFMLSSPKLKEMALQILDGFDYRKIPRFADEMDPVDVVGERAELEYEQVLEKRELDWVKTSRFR